MEKINLLELPYTELTAFVAEITRRSISEFLKIHANLYTADLREATEAYLVRNGKCLRPNLLLLSALASGTKRPEQLLPAMAAVECYHTATLIHDDIIDHDELRRGKPTVHALIAGQAAKRHPRLVSDKARDYGVATAIVAGDILFGYSASLLSMLTQHFPIGVVESILSYQSCILHPGLLLGEQLDMELEMLELSKVTAKSVEKMMRLKTGLLLGFAARTGVALGERKPIEDSSLAATLGMAAEDAGIAFQIEYDILGLFGEASQLGKPIGSDLREGKPTLLMVNAWSKGTTAERKRLKNILGNQMLTEKDIEDARAIVERTGALTTCRRRANVLIRQAKLACKAVPDELARQALLSWIDSLVKRSR